MIQKQKYNDNDNILLIRLIPENRRDGHKPVLLLCPHTINRFYTLWIIDILLFSYGINNLLITHKVSNFIHLDDTNQWKNIAEKW